MADRSLFRYVVSDRAGNVIQNAKVFVYETGTTDPIDDLFASSVGGSPQGFLITNSQGEALGWVDDGRVVDAFTTSNSGTAYYPSAPGTLLPFASFTETVQIGGGTVEASNVSYDNATSGLSADDVQEAIDELVEFNNDGYASGTWDQMQLASFLIPNRYFRCTDQGLTYRSTGAEWVYAYGLEGDVYLTSFGALPNPDAEYGDITRAARNGAAFDAMVAESRAMSRTKRRCVVLTTTVGSEYATTNGHDIVHTELVGLCGGLNEANTQRDNEKPTLLTDSADLLPVLDVTGGGIVDGSTTIRSLMITGYNIAIKALGTAHLFLDDVDMYADAVADGDNACLYVENSFWVNYFRGSQRNGGSASAVHPCIRIVGSDLVGHTPIHGIGQAFFKHLRPIFGGITFENRVTNVGGNVWMLSCEDVVSENQGNEPLFDLTDNGSTQYQPLRLTSRECERADPTGGNAFVRQAGKIGLYRSVFDRNDCYTTHLISGDGTQNMVGTEHNLQVIGGEAYDPAPGGIAVTDRDIEKGYVYTDVVPLTSLDRNPWRGVVGGSDDSSAAFLRWGVDIEGTTMWGAGSGDRDVRLKRDGAGHMALKAIGSVANQFDLDNSDATKDTQLGFLQNGSGKYYVYVPGSGTDLRFYAGSDRFAMTADGGFIFKTAAPAGLVNGEMWFDGTDFKGRVGGATKTFTLV